MTDAEPYVVGSLPVCTLCGDPMHVHDGDGTDDVPFTCARCTCAYFVEDGRAVRVVVES